MLKKSRRGPIAPPDNIQELLFYDLNTLYKYFLVHIDERADQGSCAYIDETDANVVAWYESIKPRYSSIKSTPSLSDIRTFRQSLLRAKTYNRNYSRDSFGTIVKENSVVSNPIELDNLSKALETFHKSMRPDTNITFRLSIGRLYRNIFYNVYDDVMKAKRQLVCNELRNQNTSLGNCLANLIENPPLVDTPKGNQMLDAVLQHLKTLETANLTNEDRIASMKEWLHTNLNLELASNTTSNDFVKILNTHRISSSNAKPTRSIRCLLVARMDDHIQEHQDIYGHQFLNFYRTLTPSSDKAYAVALALTHFTPQSKEDFLKILSEENALKKALKQKGPVMSIFDQSKTWRTIEKSVLPELNTASPQNTKVLEMKTL